MHAEKRRADRADRMLDWEFMIHAIEEAPPIHPPGERAGYHGLTYGFLVGEILQRVTGRSFPELVLEELVRPLALDGMYVGAPEHVLDRAAELIWPGQGALDDSPLLAEIPLHLDIRTASDGGAPIVVSSPPSIRISLNWTVSPASAASFSIRSVSPERTVYCLPPVFITANMRLFLRMCRVLRPPGPSPGRSGPCRVRPRTARPSQGTSVGFANAKRGAAHAPVHGCASLRILTPPVKRRSGAQRSVSAICRAAARPIA